MRRRTSDIWLAGVDGCHGGWLAVLMRPDGTDGFVRPVFRDFAELVEGPRAPAVVAVDIPIGLPRHSFGGRAADAIARRLLGRRGSSVFPMPSREAVFAAPGPYADGKARSKAHQHACAIAERTSTPPRRVSIFAFGIFEKVRQVDGVLRTNGSVARVFETHPEVAFQRLNGGCGLPEPKTTVAGRKIRQRLLVRAGLPPALVRSKPPKGAKPDDLLDALMCAVVARRIHDRTCECYPNPPEVDEFGLPMAIWA